MVVVVIADGFCGLLLDLMRSGRVSVNTMHTHDIDIVEKNQKRTS